MSAIVFIGVDDTDIIGSPGTGRVARDLAGKLVAAGLGETLGVSRHQLLVDPRVKYTSHNSCKGLALRTDRPLSALVGPCVEHLEGCLQEGADPGLCLCLESQVTDELLVYGARAEREVLTKDEAYALAEKAGVFLRELGGDGGGVIGALAAVGLRASGNNGRLVDIPGVREITGVVTVAEIKRRTSIVAVVDPLGTALAAEELVDSRSWIRPSLRGGHPVLEVAPADEPSDSSGRRIWVPVGKPCKAKGEKKA
jgi:hypothetical protein